MVHVMRFCVVAVFAAIVVTPVLATDLATSVEPPSQPAAPIWTLLKTSRIGGISDSVRVGGWEMIRCAASLVFLMSMSG